MIFYHLTLLPVEICSHEPSELHFRAQRDRAQDLEIVLRGADEINVITTGSGGMKRLDNEATLLALCALKCHDITLDPAAHSDTASEGDLSRLHELPKDALDHLGTLRAAEAGRLSHTDPDREVRHRGDAGPDGGLVAGLHAGAVGTRLEACPGPVHADLLREPAQDVRVVDVLPPLEVGRKDLLDHPIALALGARQLCQAVRLHGVYHFPRRVPRNTYTLAGKPQRRAFCAEGIEVVRPQL
mmetsp:Transcript_109374/g.327112  ORF Transcript_109374/g.327112 Transcript_109374/m.327112 type:complete len:242 (-) Transcript_109374:151-876(-)